MVSLLELNQEPVDILVTSELNQASIFDRCERRLRVTSSFNIIPELSSRAAYTKHNSDYI